MNPGKKIAINTLATYGRSVLAMGMALLSSRWVLSALGQGDYGLYSLVGSLVVFVVFLNTVMANGVSRFLALSIGKGDREGTIRWFNVALSLHIAVALLLLLVGLVAGEFAIRRFLSIPQVRIDASVWVFQISLISAFASMIGIPFLSLFNSKQKMTEVAFWGIAQAALMFSLALSLRWVDGDRLRFYAAGMVSVVTLIQFAQMMRAFQTLEECSIRMEHWFHFGRTVELTKFVGLIFIDSLGAMLRNQGSAVVLNLFFGPGINAAYGIANQVSSQTSQLSASMLGAFSPEITAREGRGERASMLSLADQASKFGTILMALFSIPLIVEMDVVLRLWLGSPPTYTGMFCQLILVTFLIDRLTTGNLFAINAHGKIATYQVTVGVCQVLTLSLAYLLLKLGLPPFSIGFAFIATAVLITFGRLVWSEMLFRVPSRIWTRSVFLPCLAVIGGSILVAMMVRLAMPPSLLRLFLVSCASVLASLALTYVFAMTVSERDRTSGWIRARIAPVRIASSRMAGLK